MVHRLDLDALMFDPAQIVLPDGAVITLRDFDNREVLDFARRITQVANPAHAPMHVAACVANLAEDPETALERLDQVSIDLLLPLVNWIKSMDPPTFTVSAPDRKAEIVLDGVTRGVYPLRLDTYRRSILLNDSLTAAPAEPGTELTPQELEAGRMALVASMIEGATPAMIAALPYRKQLALDALLAEALGEAMEVLSSDNSPLPGATSKAASRARSPRPRASTAGRTKR